VLALKLKGAAPRCLHCGGRHLQPSQCICPQPQQQWWSNRALGAMMSKSYFIPMWHSLPAERDGCEGYDGCGIQSTIVQCIWCVHPSICGDVFFCGSGYLETECVLDRNRHHTWHQLPACLYLLHLACCVLTSSIAGMQPCPGKQGCVSCQPCPAGTYQDNNDFLARCVLCPDGMTSAVGSLSAGCFCKPG